MVAILKTVQNGGSEPRYWVLTSWFLIREVQWTMLYHSQRILGGVHGKPSWPTEYIYTSAETKYSHSDTGSTINTTINVYNSTVDVFKIAHNYWSYFSSWKKKKTKKKKTKKKKKKHFCLADPLKCIGHPCWYCRKIGQGHHRVMIYIYIGVLESSILRAKFRWNR